MPEIDEVTVAYSRKVQLDQFEPVEHFVELEVSLNEGDDLEEVYEEYSDEAEELVEQAIAQRVASKKLQSDDDDE